MFTWIKLWDAAQVRHSKRLQIRAKSERAWFWWIATVLLKIVTLGKGPNVLEDFYTTTFDTIWTPGNGEAWLQTPPAVKYEILSHELDHLDLAYFGDHTLQDRSWTYLRRRSWLGKLWHGVQYFASWPYRRQVERWGYQRNVDCLVVRQGGAATIEQLEWIKRYFTGPDYAWMASEAEAARMLQEMLQSAIGRYERGELDALKEIFA